MRRDDRKQGKVAFPFPLSDGRIAVFYLPLPLSKADAERAGRFIKEVTVGEGTALPSGNEWVEIDGETLELTPDEAKAWREGTAPSEEQRT